MAFLGCCNTVLTIIVRRNREKGTGKQGVRRHVTGRETASYQIRAGARIIRAGALISWSTRPDMLERSVETEFYSLDVSCFGK